MREQLLNFLAPREEKIVLAGATYFVREIPESQDTSIFADDKDYLLKFVVRSVFDADGNRVFKDEDIGELKKLGKVRLRKLSSIAMRVNGQDVDEEIKNSDAVPSGG